MPPVPSNHNLDLEGTDPLLKSYCIQAALLLQYYYLSPLPLPVTLPTSHAGSSQDIHFPSLIKSLAAPPTPFFSARRRKEERKEFLTRLLKGEEEEEELERDSRFGFVTERERETEKIENICGEETMFPPLEKVTSLHIFSHK